MKIALVTPRYPPDLGGVENHVERLARRFAQRGHEVDVLTQGLAREASASDQTDGVHVRRFPLVRASKHYAVAPRLLSYLQKHASTYDLVHAHNYHAVPAMAAALSRPGAFVFTPHYHGTSESAFRRSLHRLYRHLARTMIDRAQRIICVSQRETKLLERDFPGAAERVRVIRNGVDRAEIDQAEPFLEPQGLVLSAGRLAEYKRVDRILDAIAELDGSYSLRITGEGSDRARLVAHAAALGLDSRAQFLGNVDRGELLRWFRTARVYITMSRIEAMPLTPLEVLQAGAAVVASDIDAHREVADATRGNIELVASDASPAEIARAIERAAVATPVRPSVLDWSEVGDSTLALYDEVMSLRSARS